MKQILRRQKLLLVLFSIFLPFSMMAQEITVTGTVVDKEDGLGLPGVTVLNTRTQSGAISDIDGAFTLSAMKDDILVLSFIGYVNQRVTVVDASPLRIALESDMVGLDEIVVVGYGSVKKDDLTGSVSAIDATKLNRGLATSPSELLSGKIAGVSITSDGGAPGAGATIRIRGGSSMSASNEPLIVIDGVPVDNASSINGMANPLSSIHSNDIETFTVLKDASATAIYGSRASNGVIIITTKKGAKGALKVSYDGTVSVSTKAGKVDVMSGDSFREYVTDIFGPTSDQVNALGSASTNWQNEIFHTSISTDHNVGLSGALKEVPFRVSLGYTDQEGILKTSGMERTTASLNISPKFLEERLSVNANVKGTYSKSSFADAGAIGSASQFDPTQSVYAETNYGNGYYVSLKEDGSPIDIGLANPLAILTRIIHKLFI